jgi:hypothetical protein
MAETSKDGKPQKKRTEVLLEGILYALRELKEAVAASGDGPAPVVMVQERPISFVLFGEVDDVSGEGVNRAYRVGDRVGWPKANFGTGRQSGGWVERIRLEGSMVVVTLCSDEVKYHGQRAELRRHAAGCTIVYEGDIPEGMPDDVVLEGTLVTPKSIQAQEAKAAPKASADELEAQKVQDLFARLEADVDRGVLPRREEVRRIETALTNPYVPDDRRKRINRTLVKIAKLETQGAPVSAGSEATEG